MTDDTPATAGQVAEKTDRSVGASARGKADVDTWKTIPNLIGVIRLVVSPALIALAVANQRYWFVGLYFFLGVTDLIDGMLARFLKQRSALGAKIDSVADVTLNICMIIGVWFLASDMVIRELPWFFVACSSYGFAMGFGIAKFRRLPSWHTLSAKFTHVLVFVAVICAVLDWSVWPLRFAAISATLANLESVALTCVVDRWRADVPSLFSVWPRKRENRSVL
ncbi:MAG: CDP-alcohol phosphatidyltransferase family protein [Pirellulaceae bacterium]